MQRNPKASSHLRAALFSRVWVMTLALGLGTLSLGISQSAIAADDLSSMRETWREARQELAEAASEAGKDLGKLAKGLRESTREEWRESAGERRRLGEHAREAGATSWEDVKSLLDYGWSGLNDVVSEAMGIASGMFEEYFDSLRSGD